MSRSTAETRTRSLARLVASLITYLCASNARRAIVSFRLFAPTQLALACWLHHYDWQGYYITSSLLTMNVRMSVQPLLLHHPRLRQLLLLAIGAAALVRGGETIDCAVTTAERHRPAAAAAAAAAAASSPAAPRAAAFFSRTWTPLIPRGGAAIIRDDDDDETYNERRRRPPPYSRDVDPRRTRPRNDHPRQPRPGARPAQPRPPTTTYPKKKSSSSSSVLGSLARKSVQLGTGLVAGTAQQTGKAAYFLVQPKHVDRRELVGLWRLDQQMNGRTTDSLNLELTANGEVVIARSSSDSAAAASSRGTSRPAAGAAEKDDIRGSMRQRRPPSSSSSSLWKFKPAQWPARARIEFTTTTPATGPGGTTPTTTLTYKAVVHRKLAAKNVLKLRGKIYRLGPKSRWTGRSGPPVLVGTFVARRRLQLDDDDDDNDEDEIDVEEEYDEDGDEGEWEEEDDDGDDDEEMGQPDDGSYGGNGDDDDDDWAAQNEYEYEGGGGDAEYDDDEY